MNKKIALGTAIALIAIAVALSVTLTMAFSMRLFSSTVSDVNQRQALMDYLTEIDTQIRAEYTGTIDEESLREAMASSYVSGIGDAYAAYYTADQFTAVQAQLNGEAEGFGLSLEHSSSGDIVVSAVDDGSPADAAGMQRGDTVIAVDGETLTSADTLQELKTHLSSVGKVQLTVLRNDKQQSFSLVSGTYTLTSVTSRLLDNSVGYIQISTFSAVTPQQFSKQYEALTDQGATAFVFDVRGNSGGSLEAVQEVLSYLLPRGTYATLSDANGEQTLLSSAGTTEMQLPSVTLINGSTAGEAELFAGALSVCQKTTLVGITSNGRAKVQEYFTLTSTNAVIKLTTGELTLSSGESWEGVGLTPSREIIPSSTSDVDDQLNAALAVLSAENTISANASYSASTTTAASSETGETTTQG